MLGPFDDMFDLNKDGKLDAMEKALQMQFLYEMEQEAKESSRFVPSDEEDSEEDQE